MTKKQDTLEVPAQVIINNSSPIAFKAILCELRNLLVQTQTSAGPLGMMDP
jgi:hypothetical protein